MESIKFDEGYKEFDINGDKNRVIRFNPADYGILERFSTAQKIINSDIDKIEKNFNLKLDGTPEEETEESAKVLSDLRKLIFEQIDYIFGAKVSEVAFGLQSPVSVVGGMFLFERFIDGAKSIIEPYIEKEQKASQKRIEKYTKQVRR